jgi:hypothetical protein
MMTNSSRTALLVGALAAASISFTACGGSDSGSDSGSAAGDPEVFCTTYEEFDNTDDFGDDEAELVKGLEDLRGLAPSELKDDFSTAIDAFETLVVFNEKFEAGEEIDEEDPDLIKASNELDESGEKIEDYVAANCGLES